MAELNEGLYLVPTEGFQLLGQKDLPEQMDLLPKKKIYGCSVCKQRFSTFHSLKKHMLAHAKKKAFTCNICHQKFISGALLDEHAEIHGNDLPYLCALCQEKFPRKAALLQHMMTCDAGYRTNNEYHQITSCHPLQELTSNLENGIEGDSGTSKVSGFTIEDPEGKIRQERVYDVFHPFGEHNSCKKDGEFLTPQKTRKKKRVRGKQISCVPCSRSFTARHYLWQHHLAMHCKEKPYICPSCNKEFDGKENLVSHLKVHTRRDRSCKICRREFNQKRDIFLHLKHHSQDIPGGRNVSTGKDCLFCLVCKRRFAHTSTFLEHISYHNRVMWKCEHSLPRSFFDEVTSQFLPVPETTEGSHLPVTGPKFLSSNNDGKTKEESKTSAKKDKLGNLPLFDRTNDLPVYVRGETHICSICKKSFKADLHSEYQNKSSQSDKKLFACCLCEEFILKAGIGDQRSRNSNSQASDLSKKASKNEVKKLFQEEDDADDIIDKELETIDNNAADNISMKKGNQENLALENGPNYVCEICNSSFHTELCLDEHKLLLHSEEKSFNCDICNESFVAKWFLRQHMRIHEQITGGISPVDFDEGNPSSEYLNRIIETLEDENEDDCIGETNCNNAAVEVKKNLSIEDSIGNVRTVENEEENIFMGEFNINITVVEEEDNIGTGHSYGHVITIYEKENANIGDFNSNTVEEEKENIDAGENDSNMTVLEEEDQANTGEIISSIAIAEEERENAGLEDFNSNTVVGDKQNTNTGEKSRNMTTEDEDKAHTGEIDSNIVLAEEEKENASLEDFCSNAVEEEKETAITEENDSNMTMEEEGQVNTGEINSNPASAEEEMENGSAGNFYGNTMEEEKEAAITEENDSNMTMEEEGQVNTGKRDSNPASAEEEKENGSAGDFFGNTMEEEKEAAITEENDSNMTMEEEGQVNTGKRDSNPASAEEEKENGSAGDFFGNTMEEEKEAAIAEENDSNMTMEEEGQVNTGEINSNPASAEEEMDIGSAGNFYGNTMEEEKEAAITEENDSNMTMEEEDQAYAGEIDCNIASAEEANENSITVENKSNIIPSEEKDKASTGEINIATMENKEETAIIGASKCHRTSDVEIEHVRAGNFDSYDTSFDIEMETGCVWDYDCSCLSCLSCENENLNDNTGRSSCNDTAVDAEMENLSAGDSDSYILSLEDDMDSSTVGDSYNYCQTREDENVNANIADASSDTTTLEGERNKASIEESNKSSTPVEDVRFRCIVCKEVFFTTDALFEHIPLHSMIKWKSIDQQSPPLLFDGIAEKHLSLDGKTTRNKDNLGEVSSVSDESTELRGFCNDSVKCSSAGSDFSLRENGKRKRSGCDDLVTCNEMSKESATFSNRSKESISLVDDAVQSDVVEDSLSEKDSNSASRESKVLCKSCELYFEADHLKYHFVLVHAEEKPFTCPWCNEEFEAKISLVKHIGFHMNKHFACNICHKEFLTEFLLDTHCKTHEEFIVKNDSLCDKGIPSMSGDDVASKSKYFGTKDICSIFYRKTDLKDAIVPSEKDSDFVSQKSNSKIIEYKCDICSKTFKSEYLLTKHNLFLHSSENLYVCSVCKERFSAKWFLTKHMKSHNSSAEENIKALSDKCFITGAEMERNILPIEECMDLSQTSNFGTDQTTNRIDQATSDSAQDLSRQKTHCEQGMPLNIESDAVPNYDRVQKRSKLPNIIKVQVSVDRLLLLKGSSEETFTFTPPSSETGKRLFCDITRPSSLNDKVHSSSSLEPSDKSPAVDNSSNSLPSSETVEHDFSGNDANGQDGVSRQTRSSASCKKTDSGKSEHSLSNKVNEGTANGDIVMNPPNPEDYFDFFFDWEIDNSGSLTNFKEKQSLEDGVRNNVRTFGSSSKNRVPKRTKKDKCSICKMVFSDRLMLLEHKKIHFVKDCFFCFGCNKKYRSKLMLDNHFRNHANAKDHFKLHTATKEQFVTKKKRLVNKVKVNNVVPADCKGVRSGLRTYLKTSKDMCHICKEHVVSKWVLRKHMSLYHSKSEAYCCAVCKVSFWTAENLFQHIPVHNNIKWVFQHCQNESSFDDATHKFLSNNSCYTSASVFNHSESHILHDIESKMSVSDDAYTEYLKCAKELLEEAEEVPNMVRMVHQLKGENTVVGENTGVDNIDLPLCIKEPSCSFLYVSEDQGDCDELEVDKHESFYYAGDAEYSEYSASVTMEKSAPESKNLGNMSVSGDGQMINTVPSIDTKNVSNNEDIPSSRNVIQLVPSEKTKVNHDFNICSIVEENSDGGSVFENQSAIFTRPVDAVDINIEERYDGGSVFENQSTISTRPCKDSVDINVEENTDGGPVFENQSTIFTRPSIDSVDINVEENTDGGTVFENQSTIVTRSPTDSVDINAEKTTDGGPVFENQSTIFTRPSTDSVNINVGENTDGGTVFENLSIIVTRPSTDSVNINVEENTDGGAVFENQSTIVTRSPTDSVDINVEKTTDGGPVFENPSTIFTRPSTDSVNINVEENTDGGPVFENQSTIITRPSIDSVNINVEENTDGGAVFENQSTIVTRPPTDSVDINVEENTDGGAVFENQSTIVTRPPTDSVDINVEENTDGGAVFENQSTIITRPPTDSVDINVEENTDGGAVFENQLTIVTRPPTDSVDINVEENTDGGAVFENQSTIVTRPPTDSVNINVEENTDGGTVFENQSTIITRPCKDSGDINVEENTYGGTVFENQLTIVTRPSTDSVNINVEENTDGGTVFENQSSIFTRPSTDSVDINVEENADGGAVFENQSTIFTRPSTDSADIKIEEEYDCYPVFENTSKTFTRRPSTDSVDIKVLYSKISDVCNPGHLDPKMEYDPIKDVDDDSSSCNSDADLIYEGAVNRYEYLKSGINSSLQKINQALTTASLSRKTAQEPASNNRRVCPTKLQPQESHTFETELSDANTYELLVVDKWMNA